MYVTVYVVRVCMCTVVSCTMNGISCTGDTPVDTYGALVPTQLQANLLAFLSLSCSLI